jgi:hypothetical protein
MKAHKDLSNNYRRLTGSVPKSNGGPETPIGLPLIARQTLIWLGKHQDLWGVGTPIEEPTEGKLLVAVVRECVDA